MTFGGRLTLLSGSPIIDRDVTSSTLWYAPHTGNQANGITFTSSSTDAVGPSLSLSGLPGNSVHQVFIGEGGIYLGLSASGVPYGSGLYGDGVYPGHDPDPPLHRLNGVLVNSAGDAHIGTILVDPAGGTCTAHVTQAGKRRWGVWNRYNQRPIYLKAGVNEPGIYTPTAIMPNFGPLHDNPDNCLTFVTGEPQTLEMGLFMIRGALAGSTWPAPEANASHLAAIGLDRTDGADGLISAFTFETFNVSGVFVNSFSTTAPFITAPLVGAHTAYALESHRQAGCVVYGGNIQTMFWARMQA